MDNKDEYSKEEIVEIGLKASAEAEKLCTEVSGKRTIDVLPAELAAISSVLLQTVLFSNPFLAMARDDAMQLSILCTVAGFKFSGEDKGGRLSSFVLENKAGLPVTASVLLEGLSDEELKDLLQPLADR